MASNKNFNISISYLIYDTTTKKLANFKNVNKYNSSYQATLDKIVGLLTYTFYCIGKGIQIYL